MLINQKVYIYLLLVLSLSSITLAYTNQSTNYKVELTNINVIVRNGSSTNYIVDTAIYDKVDMNQSTNYKSCIGFFCFTKETGGAVTIIAGGPGGSGSYTLTPAQVRMLRNGCFIILLIFLLILLLILFRRRKKKREQEEYKGEVYS